MAANIDINNILLSGLFESKTIILGLDSINFR